MNKKKFSLLSVLNLLVIAALVLAACSQATPSAAPEPAEIKPQPWPSRHPFRLRRLRPPLQPRRRHPPAQTQPRPITGPPRDGAPLPPSSRGWILPKSPRCSTLSKRLTNLFTASSLCATVISLPRAYYAPFQQDARHNLVDTTISVVSILVGIAIQQGLIKGVDQKMLDFFPEYKIANLDARKQAITIGNLLSMTSGLIEDDGGKDDFDKRDTICTGLANER